MDIKLTNMFLHEKYFDFVVVWVFVIVGSQPQKFPEWYLKLAPIREAQGEKEEGGRPL